MPEFGKRAKPRSVTVVVPRGPLVPYSQRLAREFGYSLEEIEGPLAARVGELLGNGPSDVAIILTAESATDRLLHYMLAVQRTRFESCEAWESIPSFSLITGRGVEGVAWNIEKGIAAAGKGRTGVAHFRHLQCDTGQVRTSDLRLGEGESSIEHGSWAAERLEEELGRSVDAIAIDTHGTEGCGKADGHVVLCGLDPSAASVDAGRALACGRGFKCPKGERPFALRQLQARVASIGSCGSLRLGDSPIQHGFNLGLSCLDGSSEAYVGTVLPSSGNRVASTALLAALSSGYTLSEATALVNALVCAARVDSSTRVCVGMPDLRLLPSVPAWGLDEAIDRDRVVLSFAGARFTVIRITAPWVLELARLGCLALDITAENDSDAITYFHRAEEHLGGWSLRVFLFRFPEQLGNLRIRFVDTRDVERAANDADERVRLWWRLGLLARPTQESVDALGETPALRETARIGIESILSSLPYDGSASSRIRRITDVLGSTEEVLRGETTAALVSKFGRSFWLPNLFAPVQRLVSSQPIDCPYCGGLAMHSMFEDSVTRAMRQVDTCAQCSILSDLTIRGPVRSIFLDCPRDATLRATIDVNLRMEVDPESADSEVNIFARLTTPSFGVVVPEPGSRSIELKAHDSAGF